MFAKDDDSGSGSDNKLSHSALNSSISISQRNSHYPHLKSKLAVAGTGGGHSTDSGGAHYKNDEDGGNKKKRGRRKLEDDQYY